MWNDHRWIAADSARITTIIGIPLMVWLLDQGYASIKAQIEQQAELARTVAVLKIKFEQEQRAKANFDIQVMTDLGRIHLRLDELMSRWQGSPHGEQQPRGGPAQNPPNP